MTGAYLSEGAWNAGNDPHGIDDGMSSASAGGFSHLFGRPPYQDGVPRIAAARAVPDVAGDAAFDTG